MSNRITNAHLEGKIRTVNALLGNAPDAPYSTPGVVVLSGAYGGVDAHRYCNELGGVSSLMGYHGTKRELATFLDGMIRGLYAAQDRTNASA